MRKRSEETVYSIEIDDDYRPLLQVLCNNVSAAKTLMRQGALLHREEVDRLWDHLHELYPEIKDKFATINHETMIIHVGLTEKKGTDN